jgi:phosphoribosylformimino-5-aminoimidazole carboxamide ribotide isomerase
MTFQRWLRDQKIQRKLLEVAKEFEANNGIQYLHLVDLEGAKIKIVNHKNFKQIVQQTNLKIDFERIKKSSDLKIAFESALTATEEVLR